MPAQPASPVAPDEAIPPRVKDKSPYRHVMAHRMDRMNQDNRNGSNECVGVGKRYKFESNQSTVLTRYIQYVTRLLPLLTLLALPR